MDPFAFRPGLLDLPRIVAGLAVFLLPGLAAADRFFPGRKSAWLLAPVFAATLLPLAGILLDFASGTAPDLVNTIALALGLGLLFGWRRVRGWTKAKAEAPAPPVKSMVRTGPSRLEVTGLVVVLMGVALVHALPHLPGQDAHGLEVPGELAGRAANALSGETDRYPVHVDEQTHIAYASRVLHPTDGYASRGEGGVLSLQGHVHERGFQVGLAQLSLLTGAGLPAVVSWAPAFWSAYLGLLVWLLLRPGIAGLAGAAFVAVLPTDVLFMGTSFLVPIGFGLAWLLSVWWVLLRAGRGARIAAILVLVTGAFFVHLVAGAAALLAALCACLTMPGPRLARAGIAAAALAPLAWIGPAVRGEVERQTLQAAGHPLEQSIFLDVGYGFWVLVLVGLAAAFAWQRDPLRRAVAIFTVLVVAVVAGSLRVGDPSLVTYYRAIHPMFLAAAIMAGSGLGALRDRLPSPRLRIPILVGAGALCALVLLAGVGSALSKPYYHVQDDASWASARTLSDQARPGDVFLSEPWHAMLYAAMSGAEPWSVLYPGSEPARGVDWAYYESSKGADAAWFSSRGITVVVSDIEPKAPHAKLGHGVYRLDS